MIHRNDVKVPDLDHDAYMLDRFGRKVSANGRIERRIVAALMAHLGPEGFSVRSVWDGEERTEVTTVKAAMELIFNLDEAHLNVGRDGEKPHWILLVLGNGQDIISDYSYREGDPDGFSALMDAFDAEAYL